MTPAIPGSRRLLGAGLIVCLAVASYWSALRGGFILDDHLLLTDNALIRAPDGLSRFWLTTEAVDYWPVTNSSFWLEWRLWGMAPAGYHVTNVLLHAISALLLWAVLRRLAIPGGFLAALLFVVHPVNVESVAWITQRKNLLALVFSLLAVLAYLEGESPSGHPRRGARAAVWYAASFAAFVLALLSKGSVAILPALVLGVVWWARPLTGRDLVRIAPFCVVAALLVVVNIWFQGRTVATGIAPPTPIERLLGAGAVIWFYLGKAVLPVGLAFVYPKWTIRPGVLWWWVPLLAAVVVTGILLRVRRAWARSLRFAWGVFCVSLVPVMGVTSVGFMAYAQVADHYQHLALIAVVALAAAGWAVWRRRTPARTRWLPMAVAALAVGTLALLTWRQSRLYADGLTLFQATVAANPDSPFVRNNLGLTLLDAGRNEDARRQFEAALRLWPAFAEAHYNLGRVLLQDGETAGAIDHYRRAVALRSTYPEYHYALGTALLQADAVEESLAELDVALRLRPDYVDARFEAASALYRAHRLPEAAEQFARVVQARPEYAAAYNNLGAVLLESGRFTEATEAYRRAVALEPTLFEGHVNLGRALVQAGDPQGAIEPLARAAALEPASADAHNDLGVALAGAGRVPEAIEEFRQALRLDPDEARVRANLDEVLAGQGGGAD